LCASLLVRSGAYCQTLVEWPPREPLKKSPRAWARAIANLGDDWRIAWVKNQELPAPVEECWRVITQNWNTGIPSIVQNTSLCQAILQLCAASDEASEGVGNMHPDDQNLVDERFLDRADELLARNERGSSLCDEIHPSRARVLPKMHTPWSGLTIRSLSLYLCLCDIEEVSPEWIPVAGDPGQKSMNLLLVPWPFRVVPSQFERAVSARGEMKNMPDDQFGFFTFRHREDTAPVSAVEAVRDLYETAKSEMGQIDGIVLPELALSQEEHDALRPFVLDRGAFLVSGVGASSKPSREHGVNRVCLDIPHEAPLWQAKHHRWKLDAAQVRQYGLGSRLSVDRHWWEHVDLSDRRLLFVSLPALVMSVLICEDLARPDPVGNLIRAVGPNLVVALLMDGPQLKGRWPERYAMALADDPGSSVLSLTSLGMSELSRPSQGASRSRVVALWKDHNGPSTEIELPAGCGGIVVSLSFQPEEEWTADGRRDYGSAVFPTLSGVRPVKGLPKWFQA
jgi:hypothetical protein